MLKKLIIILIIITAMIVGVFVFRAKNNKEISAAATKSGLVGHWTMDNTDRSRNLIYDKSGFNNVGTLVGTTTSTGRIKEARSFNGSTDFITANDSPSLRPAQITLAVWIKPTGNHPNSGRIIEKYWGGTPTWTSYVLRWGNPNGGEDSNKIYFDIGKSGGYTSCVSTSNNFNNKWSFIVGTYDKQNLKIYIDGILENGNCPETSDIVYTANTLNIGKFGGGSGYEYNGLMDDARIYNRALSAQEVADLYNSAKINFVNTATKSSSTPSAGKQLVGYWDMDANDINGTTVYDKSGKGHNGTRMGAAGANNTPKIVAGKIKQALDFDLSDDTVTVSSYPANFGTGDMSLSVWFQTTTSTGTTAPIINNEIIGALDSGFGMNMYAGSPYVYFALDDGAANPSVVANNYAINDGKWHHAVGVRDKSTNLMKIYLDGVFDNSGADTTNDISSSDDLIFGSYYSGGLNYRFNGRIDEIRIYNYALSAQEVADLYNSAKTNFVNTATKTGLVGYWTMDNTDRSRNLIYDKSGFNNVGTLVGTATSTGKIKQARSFNGTSDYIFVTDEISLKPATTVTVSTWVKLGSLTSQATCGLASAGGQYILVKSNGRTGQNEGYVLWVDADLAWYFIVANSSGTQDFAFSTSVPVVGKWTHIVGVFDKPNVKIYINGVNEGSDTHNYDLSYGTRPVFIGRSGECGGVGENANYDSYFTGVIDDTRIYARALSAQEVADLYNSAKIDYK